MSGGHHEGGGSSFVAEAIDTLRDEGAPVIRVSTDVITLLFLAMLQTMSAGTNIDLHAGLVPQESHH